MKLHLPSCKLAIYIDVISMPIILNVKTYSAKVSRFKHVPSEGLLCVRVRSYVRVCVIYV